LKIHEYQAKEILKKYNVPVPNGVVIDKKDQAGAAYDSLNSQVVVVKAQIHAGGRGKGGGVKLAKNKEEAIEHVNAILGMNLVTHQTGPEGKKVLKVYMEEGSEIAKEFYLGITLDRALGKPTFMVSTEGGMEIEKVAEKTPEKIVTQSIEPDIGIQAWQARKLAFALGLEGAAFKAGYKFILALYKAYISEDCSMAEINPLVLTKDEQIIALDCKMDFDDNASFRHKDHDALEDESEINELELEAKKFNINYIKLDGNIGCMVNGAGLAMATMDIIKLTGAEPANFLDVGGGANVETVTNGFKIILGDENVKGIFINIFGGIVRCDRVANGIVEAAKAVNITVPLVVRLRGTNAEEGKKILKESGLNIIPADGIQDGAEKIVASVK